MANAKCTKCGRPCRTDETYIECRHCNLRIRRNPITIGMSLNGTCPECGNPCDDYDGLYICCPYCGLQYYGTPGPDDDERNNRILAEMVAYAESRERSRSIAPQHATKLSAAPEQPRPTPVRTVFGWVIGVPLLLGGLALPLALFGLLGSRETTTRQEREMRYRGETPISLQQAPAVASPDRVDIVPTPTRGSQNLDAGATRAFWSDTIGQLVPMQSSPRADRVARAADALDRLSVTNVDPKVAQFSRKLSAYYRSYAKAMSDAENDGRAGRGFDDAETDRVIKDLAKQSDDIAADLLEVDKYVRERYGF